ncbi:AMP-binding enzyme [Sodiomyces alkalinus F11]|uniref:AMP-binding enzyme n=1 Tax=Sodiomyces alkalinus (strain CBS 110278 / VKM F-3762 / F11) TaxID=1314773 RepID=A0A3N2PT95_SODAK|nr:AMP-binding enzyme [Sodiomyces alkalinus F11]ROT37701.1 AMP-binding enzyme [Sodiomyces alkalinus F11]
MPIPSRWESPVPNTSLQQWIFGSATAPLPDPDRKAFIDVDNPDRFLTFAEYRALAKRVALGLRDVAGIQPGDRVLLFSRNHLYFPSIFLGVLMAGAVFTGANPTYVARELAYQLRDSGARIVVTAQDSLSVALDAAAQAGLPADRIFVLDDSSPDDSSASPPASETTRHWTKLVASRQAAESYEWVEPADARETTCCLNYSSGTTGVPKGVEISHYSYVANGVGVVEMSSLAEDHAEAVLRSAGLCFLPMYHAYAQTYFVANFAKMRIPVYVMPAFDFLKMLAHVQRYRITQLTAVPPVLVALAKHPAARQFDLSSIESVGCGAAPLGSDTQAAVERMFADKNSSNNNNNNNNNKTKTKTNDKTNDNPLLVRQGWGMTELTCTAMTWDPRRHDGKSNAVGEVMPNCRAKLVDVATGKEVTAPHTQGELWVSGPTVMRGYWRNPKATAETIVVDSEEGNNNNNNNNNTRTRWLRTGDIAYVDAYRPGALFFIVDRIKELIKVKGHQVAPAELEALLLERPDVADVAVVGVTVRGEEVPRAYVVRTPGSTASPEEISGWLDGRVARFKRLRGGVVFTDNIPKNPSGKILRKILREKAKQEVGDSDPKPSKLA